MKLILAAMLSAALIPMAPLPDDCNGCLLDPANEDSDNSDCNGCTVTLWTEVNFVQEDCGDESVACHEASCGYNWKLKYKTTEATTGDCSGHSYLLSGRMLFPTAGAVTLKTKAIDELCGFTEPFSYNMNVNACAVSIQVAGANGCTACAEI
jgi:hypothetical protein